MPLARKAGLGLCGKAFKVALGSFIAFIAGMGAKLAISGIMLFYAIRAVL